MASKPSTPNRIIEAATALFWRSGYHAVSVDAICGAALVQKGSLYHAFGSKADLLTVVIQQIWERDRGEIEKIYLTDDPLLEKLRNHLEWFGISQRRLKARYGFVPGTFEIVIDTNIPEKAQEFMSAASHDAIGIMRDTINTLLAPRRLNAETVEWITTVIRQLVRGALIEARLGNSLTPLYALPESALALIGLAPPPIVGVNREVMFPIGLGAIETGLREMQRKERDTMGFD